MPVSMFLKGAAAAVLAAILALTSIPMEVAPGIDSGGEHGGESSNNPGSLDAPEGPLGVSDDTRARGRSFGYYAPSDAEVEYAIITKSAFADALEPLALWKTKTGTAAKVFTKETIDSQYSGADIQEKIRKKLRDLDRTGADLKWVLIVADHNDIPARKLYADAGVYGLDDFYWSDSYYAALDGNWDKDGDGKHGEAGEEDWDYECYVGRLPLRTSGQVADAVDDIIDYESAPVGGDWLYTMSLWGGLMDGPNRDEYDPDQDNAYKIQKKIEPLIPQHMTVKEYYDYPKNVGWEYTSAIDGLDHATVVSDYNAGRSIINFAGQAYYEGWGLIDYDDPTGEGGIHDDPSPFTMLFGYQDAEDVANGDKLSFIYMSGCDAAEFQDIDDINQEMLFKAPDGGAIGLISSTGKTYRGEEEGQSQGNWYMNEEFWKSFFNGTSCRPGETLYVQKEQFYEDVITSHKWPEAAKANQFGYVLLGDPEVDIWTDSPGALDVQVPTMWTGGDDFSFTVTDASTGDPVEGATVTVWSPTVYAHGDSDGDGIAGFFVDASDEGGVNVTVTAHNFLPAERTASFITEPPDLSVSGDDINILGDVDWGGTVTIEASVHNEGGEGSGPQDVTVGFWDGDPSGSGRKIGDSRFAELAPGASARMDVDWSPAKKTHDIHVIVDTADLITESDENNNRAFTRLNVNLSDLSVGEGDVTISHPPALVGEEVVLNATVSNVGDTGATDVWVGFYKTADLAQAGQLGPQVPIPRIGMGETGYAEFPYVPQNTSTMIYVAADPDNATMEKSESNNVVQFLLTATYPPRFTEDLYQVLLEEDTPAENVITLANVVNDEDTEPEKLKVWLEGDIPESVNVTIDDGGNVDIIPHSNWNGNFRFELFASDRTARVNSTVDVTVSPVNDPPVLGWIGDTRGKVSLTEDVPYTLELTAEDPDGDALEFGDNTAMFDVGTASGILSLTPGDADVGTHSVNITVTDGTAVAYQLVTFEVANVQDLPSLRPIPDQTAAVGEPFQLTVNASDDDLEDRLEFSDHTHLFDIDPDNGVISFIPSMGQGGTHVVVISVSDGHNSVERSFNLTITGDTSGPDDGSDGVDAGAGPSTGQLFIIIAIIIALVALGLALALVYRGRQDRMAKNLWADEGIENAGGPVRGGGRGGEDAQDWKHPMDGPDREEGSGGSQKRDADILAGLEKEGLAGVGTPDKLGDGAGERPALPKPGRRPRRTRSIKGEPKEPIDAEFRDIGDE